MTFELDAINETPEAPRLAIDEPTFIAAFEQLDALFGQVDDQLALLNMYRQIDQCTLNKSTQKFQMEVLGQIAGDPNHLTGSGMEAVEMTKNYSVVSNVKKIFEDLLMIVQKIWEFIQHLAFSSLAVRQLHLSNLRKMEPILARAHLADLTKFKSTSFKGFGRIAFKDTVDGFRSLIQTVEAFEVQTDDPVRTLADDIASVKEYLKMMNFNINDHGYISSFPDGKVQVFFTEYPYRHDQKMTYDEAGWKRVPDDVIECHRKVKDLLTHRYISDAVLNEIKRLHHETLDRCRNARDNASQLSSVSELETEIRHRIKLQTFYRNLIAAMALSTGRLHRHVSVMVRNTEECIVK